MASLAVAALLVLADLGSDERARKMLAAAAAASSRPAECAPAATAGGRELWERARGQRVESYCTALARGFARLERAPDVALKEAALAERALPDQLATGLLQGRALLRLGQLSEAHTVLKALARKTPQAFADPAALHDLALVELATDRFSEAMSDYRTLVPRAELLEDVRVRQRVFIEAGALASALGAAQSSEAIGYLAEARRLAAAPGLSDLTIGLLALALDRAERHDQAKALVREASGPWATERLLSDVDRSRLPAASVDGGKVPAGAPFGAKSNASPKALPVALVEGELHAAIAMLAERTDPKLARAHWTAFLASPAAKGPWAEHAKKKLAVATAGERKGAQ